MTDHEREQRIDELVHTEPTVRRTPAQKLLRVLSVLCGVVALAAAGVLVIAYAQLRSCTNTNFADPAGFQKAAVAARVQFGKAIKLFSGAVEEVFKAAPGTTAQRHAATNLKVDTQRLLDASSTWQAAENRAYTYRVEHPISSC